MEIKELTVESIEEVKGLFFHIFTQEPWNDDWSDGEQLHAYLVDLMGNRNSLTLGAFNEGELIGLSIGSIRHWYVGTEYHVDELCIKTEEQGKGYGTAFLEGIESFIKERGVEGMFLQTERDVPAYSFYKKNGFKELEGHVSFAK